MKWKGKLIGFLLGLLTRRPQFILIGLALGHLYDMGLFSRSKTSGPPPAPVAGDPYTTLGITSSASDDDVEQAYRRMISDYHPDKVANAAKELRELAEVRAREINAAYETIKQLRRHSSSN